MVDYKTGDVGAAVAILNVVPTLEWSVVRYGIPVRSSVKTSDRMSRSGFDDAATAYMDALRAADCRAFAKVVDPREGERACPTAFDRLRDVRRQLDANPDAEPDYMGGNRSFGFYGLTLERPTPRFWTINVTRYVHGGEERFAVLDMIPGPLPDR